MTPFRTILVLCEGNHCRSPLAEAMLRKACGDRITVHSAGLQALLGHPADSEIARLAAEIGCSLDAHRGRNVDATLALRSDLILVMDEAQKEETIRRFPSARGRVYLLGHWLPPDRQQVPDPYRRGPEAMRAALSQIQEALAAWMPRLLPK